MTIVTLMTGTRTARKEHRCWHCHRPIVKGTEYAFGTFRYDDVYTLKYHVDCEAASWVHYKETGFDPFGDEGYPPLIENIWDMGEIQHDIDNLRGRFPHVACRLEFHTQFWGDQ